MPRRLRSLVPIVLVALVLASGCGLRHHTIAGRTGVLTVTPASGKVGTPFALAASKFLPGEALTFEIDIPNRPPFIGPSHTTDATGSVSSTYMPLTGDPVGTYTIKAVGNEGTKAQATLTVAG
ncbi:MAG TPA: hypothetical protein VHT30_04580 [Acidimicrobiales bacterium]|nr:hypothetical protein [Acidimicrobiales bacterium]